MSAKMTAIVLGIIVILAGLLGFVGNPLVGASGMFVSNAALDIVWIVIGLVLLAVAIWAPAQSAMWLKVGGVIYLILAVLGFFMNPVLGFLAVSTATTWLHVVLGVLMLAGGFWGKNESMGMNSMSTPAM